MTNRHHTHRWWVAGLIAGLVILALAAASPALAQGPGWFGGRPGGMMGGWNGWGRFGCGGYGAGISPTPTTPLSIAEAKSAVEAFLQQYGDANLALKEVMIFDNGGYAEIVEKDTGIGAMEVLIHPVTKRVVPEMGPNMMWNTRYGMMGRGMMGWGYNAPNGGAGEMTVTPEEAVDLAQEYLDRTPWAQGLKVEDEVDPFYGYYTLHVLKDGKVAGMLSVNGYTGQVWYHFWHGNFVEMSEELE